MLLKGILVTADNEMSVVTVESENLYANIEPLLDASAVSCIRARFCPPPFVFYCDDEFCRKQPPFNEVGSFFYGYQYHRRPILGSILILAEEYDGIGIPETKGLTEENISYLRRYLRRTFHVKEGGSHK